MSIAHRLTARAAALLAALVGVALITMSFAPASNAASAYRFWGYFQLAEGKWTFAQKGADQTTPADGSVEGWRYALAGPTDTRQPRDIVTFEDICADTEPKSGTKRVGVVIDYGRKADAKTGTPPEPTTACAQVSTKSTGAEVLAAATGTLRIEKKLTCGINDWPATGCGDEVKEIPAAAKATDEPVEISAAAAENSDEDKAYSTNTLLLGGVVVVVLIGILLVLAMRSRKNAESA